jgi:hypothetical protein
MSFKGIQTLSDSEKLEAANIAALAGLDFFDASHIWYMDETQAVMLRIKTGVDVVIEPSYDP